MMNKLSRGRIVFAVFGSLVVIPTIILVALLNFDWNRAKPWLNARTSEAIGRPFVISGNLAMTWERTVSAKHEQGWRSLVPWPHLVGQDIHISNLPINMHSPQQSDMANIRQIEFSLNPLALLSKKIVIPILHFDSPEISLLRRTDGTNNWTFRHDNKPSSWQLELKRIVLAKGVIHLIDDVRHVNVTANIDTLDDDPVYGIEWRVHGNLNGEPVSGNGKAGAVLSLQHQTVPYPVMANFLIGQTVISLDGWLTKPTDLAALDMHLKVSGISMARLYAISGILLPETPPFSTSGHLVGTMGKHNSHWVYEKFRGKVGSSDISGNLDYQSKQPRALLSGTVISHLLHFADLAPLIGADSNVSKANRGAALTQPANKVLPVEEFKTERWRSINADIKFSAEKIVREKALPINKLTTNLHLQDGVLSLLPLDFDMAGGKLRSTIKLDSGGNSSKVPIKATMKITARHLKLKQLFPTVSLLQSSAGEINGDASLSAIGNSVASLLGSSNGEVKMLINQGTISKLLLEEMGLNIGNVVLTRLSGDKQVKLNCMAADFGVANGLMQTRSFIVDTDDAILYVSGNINLAQEQPNLIITPKSKGLRIFSLRAPLYVRGSFKQPRVTIDKSVMAMKAGSAVALAILAPVAALIPLIKTGPGENSECAKLLAEARIKPMAPPPGKAFRKKVKHNTK